MELTPRQSEVLTAIADYRHRHGYAPTLAEVGKKLGVSRVTICGHVDDLERKGAIRRDPHKTRSVEVLVKVERRRLVFPILGEVR